MEIGTKIRPFTSIDQDGDAFSSEDLEGQPFVLYFYPRDETPGCTKEACSFRDNLNALENLNICVLGVSPDSPESHQRFMENHKLNFTLLSDKDLELCYEFDTIKEGNRMERSSFIIDSHGVVRWIERPVNVEGHVERIIKALKELKL